MTRGRIYLLIALPLIAAAAVISVWLSFQHGIIPIDTHSFASSMKLESSDFTDGGALPSQLTCYAGGERPGLVISGVPKDAKSLALILHDPDAPSDFVHWVFWNAEPTMTALAPHGLPKGIIQGRNGTGKAVYTAACPPSMLHHYVFELFALDSMLTIPETTDAAGLRAAMQGHVLDTTTLTGTFENVNSPI